MRALGTPVYVQLIGINMFVLINSREEGLQGKKWEKMG
jgi:hypothetical protein